MEVDLHFPASQHIYDQDFLPAASKNIVGDQQLQVNLGESHNLPPSKVIVFYSLIMNSRQLIWITAIPADNFLAGPIKKAIDHKRTSTSSHFLALKSCQPTTTVSVLPSTGEKFGSDPDFPLVEFLRVPIKVKKINQLMAVLLGELVFVSMAVEWQWSRLVDDCSSLLSKASLHIQHLQAPLFGNCLTSPLKKRKAVCVCMYSWLDCAKCVKI